MTYAIYYLNNSTIDHIKKIVINFYNADEILVAKKCLWQLCSRDLEPFVDKKPSDKRSSNEANLVDIFDALLKLDANEKLPNFVAQNIEKIPDRQP